MRFITIAAFCISAAMILQACGYGDKKKLATAAECEQTELRDKGRSIAGVYYNWDIEKIICPINAVGMPDWAKSDLQSTRPIDGRKTAEWGNFVASWSFNGEKVNFTVRIK